MAESAAQESPAQKAARLRREKREKKILEGGSNRLARITNVSGREEDLQPAPAPKPSIASDPGDVDIPHIPAAIKGLDDDEDNSNDEIARLRAAFRAQPPSGGGGGSSSSQPGQGPQAGAEGGDPLMQLMQQMLGAGAPGADGSGPGAPQLPPALASLLGGQLGQQAGGMGPSAATGTTATAVEEASPTNVYLWKIVHAIFSLSLGIYIVMALPFSGSKDDRERPDLGSSPTPQGLFWIFATAELVLQSTRFLLERGKPPQAGMIVTVANFLPEPYRGYVLLANRYAAIWTTLSEDALVIIVVLGVVTWWRGQGA